MSRIGIIAACGKSGRAGLKTTKGAFWCAGKRLIAHQLAFLRRSCCDRVIIICRSEYLSILARSLDGEDHKIISWLAYDGHTGWVGSLEQAIPLIRHYSDSSEDEVVIISIDNIHEEEQARKIPPYKDALHTYTNWDCADRSPSQGPICGRVNDQWVSCSGVGFNGFLFTGYIVCKADVFCTTIPLIKPSLSIADRNEREISSWLELLHKAYFCVAVPYGGHYLDVASLNDLALIHALKTDISTNKPVTIGAGVLVGYNNRAYCLLIERKDNRGWGPPGGLVDKDETYAQAAVRELEEETGIEIEPDSLRLVGVYPTCGKYGEPGCSVIFTVQASEKYAIFMTSDEVKSISWYNKEKVLSLTIPFDLKQAVGDFFDGWDISA